MFKALLDKGFESFYKEENGDLYFFDGNDYTIVPVNEKVIDLKRYKKKHGVIKKNSGASLIDLGDGIALLRIPFKIECNWTRHHSND